MIIDGYVAEQMKKAMLNSEQEQVKVYDAYYNKGVTDGYNQALKDLLNKVVSLRVYDNDLCLEDLIKAKEELWKR